MQIFLFFMRIIAQLRHLTYSLERNISWECFKFSTDYLNRKITLVAKAWWQNELAYNFAMDFSNKNINFAAKARWLNKLAFNSSAVFSNRNTTFVAKAWWQNELTFNLRWISQTEKFSLPLKLDEKTNWFVKLAAFFSDHLQTYRLRRL